MNLSRALPSCLIAALVLISRADLSCAEQAPRPSRLEESPVLRHLQPNPLPRPPATPAEAILKTMWVEDGFRVELVAAEPNLNQPVAFTFDEQGRLWVVEAYSYPQKRPPGQGLDKIVIFEDRDGDGRFETRKVFAENLNLVSGLAVGYGGVWVGAAPELLFIPDRDGDDRPDGPPEILLNGFGFQDTHETLNNFTWGPDGWLYGNQGVFNYSRIGKPSAADHERVEMRAGVWRYHPARREFEVFAHGGSNQWGLDFDEHGQLFMTHCRSFFGRGPTTHVILGAHYWNQANANYAPFISSEAPPELPFLRNFMLASARYGHGEGGAGKPGSNKIYGGHAHVGTMIYLGDNWPDSYRDQLFTHNLHGHQINHQINRRLGSGFDTVHFGRDFFYCEDPTYVAIDLQYGPDGAVYVIDWVDRQHCHNPNAESWDRATGRLYRIEYEATYKPRSATLRQETDLGLVQLQLHHNDWFVRTARRLLHERALARSIDPAAREALRRMLREHADPTRRLRALWALHAIDGLSDDLTRQTLADRDEYVRAWTIQLMAERHEISPATSKVFLELARTDPSAVVRLCLASAVQRISEAQAWPLLEALSQHGEDRDDRNLPLMIWYGLAERLPKNLDRAFALAATSKIPVLTDYVYWYASKIDPNGLNRVLSLFPKESESRQHALLTEISLAMAGRVQAPQPALWRTIGPKLYRDADPSFRWKAEQLGAIFGDRSFFPELRRTLSNPQAGKGERQHAFAVLTQSRDAASLPVFLQLLREEPFRERVIPVLARFDDLRVPDLLLRQYSSLTKREKGAALNALSSRPEFALPLLQAIEHSRIPRTDLTAFQIRQLAQLNNREVLRQIEGLWGKLNRSSSEKQEQVARLEKIFSEAPLWAYSESEGRKHFQQLCASCHFIKNEGNRIGPELTGAGANGIRYFLENIIDPNAVIGHDYEMAVFQTNDGEIISGLIRNETPDALTIRTTTEELVLPKKNIAVQRKSDVSLMPEGLLDTLKEREQIELLKFLMQN